MNSNKVQRLSKAIGEPINLTIQRRIIVGYQESYLFPTNKKNFNKLVNVIKSRGYDYYDEFWAYPVEIIEFIQDHLPFKKGDKAIYLSGERYPQSYYGKYFLKDVDFRCNIVFTENVNPVGIWKDAGDDSHVTHNEFKFE